MKLNIFSYLDYVQFLKDACNANSSIYGYKAKLAEAAGCQRSFLSQVLAGQNDLSAEQSSGLAEFWEFSAIEADYFLTLVFYARSSSKSFKAFLKAKINRMKEEQENLAKRFVAKAALPDENANIYYSSWMFAAIHILCTVPEFRKSKSISERLNLSLQSVEKTLHELKEMGLVINNLGEWFATERTIHLPKSSKFNSLNHLNWRQKAVENSYLDLPDKVHYTSICSISKEDAEKLKQQILKMIDENRKIVALSKEEDVYCLTCDWFKI